jgi:hypothetical protein
MNKPERIPQAAGEFTVGGVKLPRPFRIRRLGQFGLYVAIGATGPSRRSFTASSRATTRASSNTWPGRARPPPDYVRDALRNSAIAFA